jgi:hypothetical protein
MKLTCGACARQYDGRYKGTRPICAACRQRPHAVENGRGGRGGRSAGKATCTVYVKGTAMKVTTKEVLNEMFGKFGSVKMVTLQVPLTHLPNDPTTAEKSHQHGRSLPLPSAPTCSYLLPVTHSPPMPPPAVGCPPTFLILQPSHRHGSKLRFTTSSG